MAASCTENEVVQSKSGEFIVFEKKQNYTYAQAVDLCTGRGATLPTVKTQEFKDELVKVVEPCKPRSRSWYIGLKFSEEKIGMWSDGTAYVENNTGNNSMFSKIDGVPANQQKECVTMRKGELKRTKCSFQWSVVCFKPRQTTTTEPTTTTQSSTTSVGVSTTRTTTTTTTTTESDSNKPKKQNTPPKTTSKTPTTIKPTTPIITSSKPVTSSRYALTSHNPVVTTTKHTSFINSDPIMFYSLIGGAALLLLLIILATVCACRKTKKQKKKKKTKVVDGGEQENVGVDLYDIYQSNEEGNYPPPPITNQFSSFHLGSQGSFSSDSFSDDHSSEDESARADFYA